VNPAAKAAAKEFRRARNDVLKAIGVVQKKEDGEFKRRKTTEREMVATLFRENAYGPWLKAMDSGLTLLSLWWLMSLRSRFQVRFMVKLCERSLTRNARHSDLSRACHSLRSSSPRYDSSALGHSLLVGSLLGL
jgi:hypothetical protein